MILTDVTKKILEQAKNSKSPIIQQTLKQGLVPYMYITPSGSLKMGHILFDGIIARKLTAQTESAHKKVVRTLVHKQAFFADEWDEYCQGAIILTDMTSNPFYKSGIYSYSEDIHNVQGFTFNERLESTYYDHLSPVFGGKIPELLLKGIRQGDQTTVTINGKEVSFFEIAQAWQMFHDSKIMAILGLYSEGRGKGKTFSLSVVYHLLTDLRNKGGNVGVINRADTEASKWGNPLLNKQLIIYDDLPDNWKQTEQLIALYKSVATNWNPVDANIKGSGMVSTNPFNISFSTNHKEAIPMERGIGADGNALDRRVYPIALAEDCYSQEELAFIESLDLPNMGEQSKSRNIALQDLLNHFAWIYENTKDNKEIRNQLFKRVPVTKFRNEVAGLVQKNERFSNSALQAKNQEEFVAEVAKDHNVATAQVQRIISSSEVTFAIMDDNYTGEQVKMMQVTEQGIKNFGELFIGHTNSSLQELQAKYFKGCHVAEIDGQVLYLFEVPNMTIEQPVPQPPKQPKQPTQPKARVVLKQLSSAGNLFYDNEPITNVDLFIEHLNMNK
jgi:hypothetical protein